jgi:predicted RNA-binding Zn-ribbon protein involved in translation (DUF1610 family)
MKKIDGKLFDKCPNCKEEIYIKDNSKALGICPGCGQYLIIEPTVFGIDCVYLYGKKFAYKMEIHFTTIYNKDGKTEKDTL